MTGARVRATASRLATGVDAVAWLVLAVSLLWFAAGVVLRDPGGSEPLYDLWLYNAVYAAGAVLCLRSRTRDRSAWRCVGGALLVTLAANAWYTLRVAPLDEAPYPSVADALYLLFYPFLYVAVVRLARARVHRFHPSMWLDGVVAGLGAAAVVLATALGPLLQLSGGGPAVVLTNLAYPAADLLLLVLLAASCAALGLRADRCLLWLGGGLLLTLVADIGYLLADSAGAYVEGGGLDLLWLLGVVALAVAARVPPGRLRELPAEDAVTRIGWRVLALPGAASGASLLLLAVGWGDSLPLGAGVSAAGCALGAGVRAVLTFREVRDLPEARRLARTDELTGLANRRALYERCDRVLAGREPALALLLLDLDGFKDVNDSFGHSTGDLLLVNVARRLRGALRAEDLLARLGGDEFAVLLPGVDASRAQAVAASLRDSLTEPFTVDTIRLHVRASVGVATGPVPAASRSELLRCADVAMYQAKLAGTGVALFAADSATGDRLRIAGELREAFAGGELVVHLQPQVQLATGRVVGAEALVRWQHPSRGLLLPGAFLTHLEWAGLQRQLADAVLDLALAAAARWWDAATPVPVAVNLSSVNVCDLDLPDKLAAAAARHGLPLRALTVELTEHTLVTEPEKVQAVLAELRSRGVGVSIDDYGTGYSSLSYLRHLPADELKLDRSLSVDLTTDARARAIVRHTVALAHELGMRLVAEGIEDAATGHALRALGCDTGQGFHLARPMPVADFLAWLDARAAAPAPVTRAVAGPPAAVDVAR